MSHISGDGIVILDDEEIIMLSGEDAGPPPGNQEAICNGSTLRDLRDDLRRDLRDLERMLECGEGSGCGWTMDIPYRLPVCGHVFCRDCVEGIFDKNTWYQLDACPACNRGIYEPPMRDTALEKVISWLTYMKGGQSPPKEQVVDTDYFHYRFEKDRIAYLRLTYSID